MPKGITQNKRVEQKEALDQVRDILNWLAVYEEEYNLPKEVTSTLQKGLLSLVQKIGKM